MTTILNMIEATEASQNTQLTAAAVVNITDTDSDYCTYICSIVHYMKANEPMQHRQFKSYSAACNFAKSLPKPVIVFYQYGGSEMIPA